MAAAVAVAVAVATSPSGGAQKEKGGRQPKHTATKVKHNDGARCLVLGPWWWLLCRLCPAGQLQLGDGATTAPATPATPATPPGCLSALSCTIQKSGKRGHSEWVEGRTRGDTSSAKIGWHLQPALATGDAKDGGVPLPPPLPQPLSLPLPMPLKGGSNSLKKKTQKEKPGKC